MKVTNLKPVLTRYDGGETSWNAGPPTAEPEHPGLPSSASSANRPQSLLPASASTSSVDRLAAARRQSSGQAAAADSVDAGPEPSRTDGPDRVAGSAAVEGGQSAKLEAGADLETYRGLRSVLASVVHELKPGSEPGSPELMRDVLALYLSTAQATHPEKLDEFAGTTLSNDVRLGELSSKHAKILGGALSAKARREIQLASIEKASAKDLANGRLRAGDLDQRCRRASPSLSDGEVAQIRRGVADILVRERFGATQVRGDKNAQSFSLKQIAAICGLSDIETAKLALTAAVIAASPSGAREFRDDRELTPKQRTEYKRVRDENMLVSVMPRLASMQPRDVAALRAKVKDVILNNGLSVDFDDSDELKRAVADEIIDGAVAMGVSRGESEKDLSEAADRISGELGIHDAPTMRQNRKTAAKAYIGKRLAEIGPGDLANVIKAFEIDDPELAEGVRVGWAEAVMALLPLDHLTDGTRDMLTRDAGVTWPSSFMSIEHEHERVRARKAADA